MSYLALVVLVVPACIGFAATFRLGSNRGTLLGGLVAFLTVLGLLLFQVSPPEPGRPGSETSRLGYAWGLMMFESPRWVPSFLIAAAIGAVIGRMRARRGDASR